MRPAAAILVPALLALGAVARLNLNQIGRPDLEAARAAPAPKPRARAEAPTPPADASAFLTNTTSQYWVNGTDLPDVDFDVGESYAGQMPLSDDADEKRRMFFWFFPMQSPDPRSETDIIIWLNGGPGCSSMEGALEENGPISWRAGTFRPVRNRWAWNLLAHVVYVDQPIGTSFSTGPVTATSTADAAAEFLLFWRRFITAFALEGSRIYVTGESYAGVYCPYIAGAMLDAAEQEQDGKNGTAYFDVRGMLIYDPVIGPTDVQMMMPAVPFTEYWRGLHPFNDSFSAQLRSDADACGYSEYLDKYLQFPSTGQQPVELPGAGNDRCGFGLINNIIEASVALNPCWDIYQVAEICPLLWDVTGFPGTIEFSPPGAEPYFNRTDVRKALHAPSLLGNGETRHDWLECAPEPVFVNDVDLSLPSSQLMIPAVINRTQNVIIAHGALDFVLIANGTLLSIQNMTWGGETGFTARPTDPFYVPYHGDTELVLSSDAVPAVDLVSLAGAGVVGSTRTERGLTYAAVNLAGHMGPEFAPAAAMRLVELMLGRIDSLQDRQPFKLVGNASALEGPLGNGTGPPTGR